MGIKSKNSDRKKQTGNGKKQRSKGMAPGYFAAFALILAATLTFLSQYPNFKARVSVDDPDILSGSEFTHELYQANIVLYKQAREFAAEKLIGYRDVYLTAEEETAADFDEYYDFGKDTPLIYAGEYLDNLLEEWDTSFQSGLATRLDYRIIDHDNQYTFANTERDLLQLGTKEADDELNAYYPYYVKLSFDAEGRLAHVWAKGEDVDALITKVQNVMKSRYLERNLYENLSYSAYADVDWEDDIYYYDSAYGQVKQMRLHIANTPKNCTICYALTGEQLAEVKASSRVFLSMQSVGNYYNIGVQELFRAILLVLGILALLLPFWKSYHLHESESLLLPLHLETIAVLLFCGFSVLGVLSASLVMYSISDRGDYSFAYMLRSALPGISEAQAQGVVMVGNFLILMLLFSLWFFLLTQLGQVYVLGIRSLIRKRCLCYRIFRCMRILVRKKKAKVNREFEHMDLERDMNIPLLKLLMVNYFILVLISVFWVLALFPLALYTVWLYYFLRKRIRVVQEKYGLLLEATRSLADGNLQTEFAGDWGMFASFREELSEIQTGFSMAVEEEVKSQRMRTELITNVSHDLKTPLTAIITYIDLLQEEGVTESQREEYLEVLERKSLRLKALIEDLFEVSKASSGNVTFHTEKVDICHLVRQMYLEYEDKAVEADLTFRFAIPDKKLFLMLDGEKTGRIFDNLYGNIIKYAMPHTRVYVTVEERENEVSISLKNISGTELNVPAESLTDRFVRGDSARSTEGSGLGLAIARSFVELQGGRMEIEVDGDLFKATLVWKM